jgi:hypothetical protein
MGTIDKKILEEINRYKSINRYISEQELPPPPGPEAPMDAPPMDAPPMEEPQPGAEQPAAEQPAAEIEPAQPIDAESDPDVEEVGADDEETEELDITDLVNTQKNIETKQEEYFQNLFTQIQNMETKLAEMDKLMTSINNIETKIEKYKPKTAQEKLELRTLDSGPFKQKLSDFFADKQVEMEKSGKNEYILTTDDIQDYSPSEIEDTFNTFGNENDFE